MRYIHYIFVGQCPTICIEYFRVNVKILWNNRTYYNMYFVVENVNTMFKLLVNEVPK